MKKIRFLTPILASMLIIGCGNTARTVEDTYYTVTFSTGCSYTIDPVSVKEFGSIGMPNDPVRDGYTFLGWYTDINYDYKYDFTNLVNKNFTLYAKWSDPLEYNITYHLLDGATNNNVSTYTIEESVTFEDASKDGYTFLGWYNESTYENKITSIGKGSTGNVDLYGKFETITYTITYHMNGGTNYIGNVTSYTVEDDVILSVPDAYKPGYSIFAGWYYDEELTQEAGMGWNKGKFGNIDLYAAYAVPITYSIIYHNVDGLVNTNPITYNCETSVSLVDVEKEGYIFKGWYLESDFRTPVEYIRAGTTGDFNVYAKFSPKEYTITYDPMGGVLNPIRVETYNIEDDVALVDPITLKPGYTEFDCWCLDEELTTSVGKGWQKGTRYGDLTLYAKYKSLAHYSITYVGLIAGCTNTNPDIFTVEDEIILTDPFIEGYQFEGWYKESTFENEITKIESGTAENVSVYAKINPIEYTITYKMNGGVNSDDNVESYTILDAVFLSAPKSLKTGYSSFAGWFYDSAFTQPVGNGWNVGRTGDVTLYAKYGDIITYTVTYEMDGGTNNIDNITSFTVATPTFSLKNPETKVGWVFAGWFADEEFTQKVTTIAGGQSENIILYARWKKVLANTSWSEIKEISDAGNAKRVFDIGDVKRIQINGQDTNANGVIDTNEDAQAIRIIDFNHDYTDPDDKENSKIGITFEFSNLISDADGYSIASLFQYVDDIGDAWFSNGDYPNSTLRKNLVGEGGATQSGWYTSAPAYDGVPVDVARNPDWNGITVLDMLPDDMVDVLASPAKDVTVYSNSTWTTVTVKDKLFIPSMFEIVDNFSLQNRPVEGTKYAYYINDYSLQKPNASKTDRGHVWTNAITDLGFDGSSFDPVSFAGYVYAGDLIPYGCYWTRTPDFMGCVWHIEGYLKKAQEHSRTASCFAMSVAPFFCI